MTEDQFVAYLTREARILVLNHHADYAERPNQHRGCLWCEDGRLSHVLSDYAAFYCDDDLVARVSSLYARAYMQGYNGIM